MLSSLRRQRPASASVPRLPDAAALLSALPDPVLALDRDNIVRFVNPAAEQFFGTSAAGPPVTPAEILAPEARSPPLEGCRGARSPNTTYRSRGPRLAPRSADDQERRRGV
jgi:PAS domain-containing protein